MPSKDMVLGPPTVRGDTSNQTILLETILLMLLPLSLIMLRYCEVSTHVGV